VAAGLVAALRQASPRIAPAVLKGLIQRAASTTGVPWDYELGFGIVNAAEALKAVKKGASAVAKKASRAGKKKKGAPRTDAWMLQPNSLEDMAAHTEWLRRGGRAPTVKAKSKSGARKGRRKASGR
jgi:hypothetical protein